ncbi:MAG: hypothetical protein OEZ01_04325 [Candidatus Heimdallarchaeota archaeon]|nr:hypothetical protein [Candidatus Heimdallarchaeota archaeon]
MMKTTTLDNIREHSPCQPSWGKLLKSLGKAKADDEPLTYLHILETLGLDDAIWCMRAEHKYKKDWKLFAVFCARQNKHLLDKEITTALNTVEDYINRTCPKEKFDKAKSLIKIAAARATWVKAARAARAAAAATWAAEERTAICAAEIAAAAEAAAAAGAATWAAEAEIRQAQTVEFERIIKLK